MQTCKKQDKWCSLGKKLITFSTAYPIDALLDNGQGINVLTWWIYTLTETGNPDKIPIDESR